MEIDVWFDYRLKVWHGKLYNIHIKHFYSSNQVERFSVGAKNGKQVVFEKRLHLHKQPWKIISGKFENPNIQEAAQAVMQVQDLLDVYLEKRNGQVTGEFKFPLRESWYKQHPKNKS